MKKLILCLALLTPAYAYAQPAPEAPSTEVPAEEAPAADVPAPEMNPVDTLGDLVSAVKDGNWRLVVSLLLGIVMFAGAKFRDKISWFKGDRGGAILAMILAMAGAVATALASDAAMDWKLFLGAAGVAWTAVGGYTWIKRLFWPKDKKDAKEKSE